MDDLIELKVMYPVQCSIRCSNDPEVIKEAQKELVGYSWFIYNQWQKENQYGRYHATWNT